MAAVPAYILAGGQSRRFGSDKARAELGGVPLLVRVAQCLGQVASSLTVIADRPDKYADLGLTTLADAQPHQGPLGGLHTALTHARSAGSPGTRVLVASCDHLELRTSWLHTLLSSPQGTTAAFHEARWQPFPGIYAVADLAQVGERLARGQLALQPLLEQIAQPLALPEDWPEVAQANTPEELRGYVVTQAKARERP